jgi:hypothetical protein
VVATQSIRRISESSAFLGEKSADLKNTCLKAVTRNTESASSPERATTRLAGSP